jgi:peptide/nickel transport system substrate-binding protein
MKLFAWRSLAVSSVLLIAVVSPAETRPLYGGTVHIATRQTFISLDPSQAGQADSVTEANITRLIFETLVTMDEHGRAQPELATSWQASRDNRKWRFRLRPGIRFHDGTTFAPEICAASLRLANPSWRVETDRDSIIIEQENPNPELPAVLALTRNAIFNRSQEGMLTGTGPFRAAGWKSGKGLSLTANDDYWGGRSFLDSIEIETGKSFRDQMIAFRSGKADLIEVAPEQTQELSIDAQAVRSSLPTQLLTLVFSRDAQSSDEKLLRQALALSIDRGSIESVLLQGTGQPAGSLLPNWMTGYAFVFSTQIDLAQARRIRDQVRTIPTWTLGYDAGDPVSRLIAERIALNARDAGLSVRPATAADPDLLLVRIALESYDPWIALERVTLMRGLAPPAMATDSVESLYAAEQSLLATERIIPLFHLPLVYAVSPVLRNWKLQKDGTWNFVDAWLENKP